MSLRPARNMSLGRWLLVACFSSVKNHNGSGPHLFPSVTTHAKNPFASLGRSYTEQKNHFAIGRNSKLCSYHTDLSRFVLPISDPSVLIRWPINRSNRFSDFLRLDRLDRFGKIIKSIFSKFWKREFQFFSDFQNFFGFWKFREFIFLYIIQIFWRHVLCRFSLFVYGIGCGSTGSADRTLRKVTWSWNQAYRIFRNFSSFHQNMYDVYNIFWCKIWTFKPPRTILWTSLAHNVSLLDDLCHWFL